jgi:hypothetical protein
VLNVEINNNDKKGEIMIPINKMARVKCYRLNRWVGDSIPVALWHAMFRRHWDIDLLEMNDWWL